MENTQSRILIVEDEPLIAMELEELVQELGCEAVGPAGDVPTALRLLADRELDAAVLDIKINGDTSFTIADELLRLGKPWIFTTGCDAEVLDGHYSDVPLVIKPFSREDVSALITEMVLGYSSQETKKNPVMPVR
jgi:DNA-binding NarL/FixJ family response regulator